MGVFDQNSIRGRFLKVFEGFQGSTIVIIPHYTAPASGLYGQLCRPVNWVLLTFLLDVLQTLDHLTKAFQLINSSIVHSLEIVEVVCLDLENFKVEYTLEHIASLLADGST